MKNRKLPISARIDGRFISFISGRSSWNGFIRSAVRAYILVPGFLHRHESLVVETLRAIGKFIFRLPVNSGFGVKGVFTLLLLGFVFLGDLLAGVNEVGTPLKQVSEINHSTSPFYQGFMFWLGANMADLVVGGAVLAGIAVYLIIYYLNLEK